jgi:monoamine oxidase
MTRRRAAARRTAQQPLPSRRDFFAMIGALAGSGFMFESMSALGAVEDSRRKKPLGLSGKVRDVSVLVLGAGLGGLTAAYELRKAGYRVQVLEYSRRIGGRCWTIRGGDTFTELGGAKQTCEFERSLYFNPGPMRIPHQHGAILEYCRQFGVTLEPFIEDNSYAYVHAQGAFGGRPQRFQHVRADFEGYVAELLAKASPQFALDERLSAEDLKSLLEALRDWGALDAQYRYRRNESSSRSRGYQVDAGGGLAPAPVTSTPLALRDLLRSNFWRALGTQHLYEWQPTLLQPVGGMDRIAAAFASRIGPAIETGLRVTEIDQDERGVTVTYSDAFSPGAPRQTRADFCVCTIPASILGQMPIKVSPDTQAAIRALPYSSSVKVALQFKRRFWEQDEGIYGGITFTDLPINQIVYPSCNLGSSGKGLLVGGYVVSLSRFKPAHSYEVSGLSPQQRIEWALRHGAAIHPHYAQTFETGFSVAWHRVPNSLGCFGQWERDSFERHYRNLCKLDGRIVLAGEHASRLPGWQEGAILSALDAIERLHRRVLNDSRGGQP